MVARTATLREVVIPRQPGFGDPILLLVDCDRCGRQAMHGGGLDPTRIHEMLGHRVADCGCGSYEIVDRRRLIVTTAVAS